MNPQARAYSQRGGAIIYVLVLFFVALLCLVLYWARHPILRYAAESLVVDEPAEHADALLLLGDDNFYADRATHAVELFRHGVAPVIVASGRRLRPSAGIAELEEHDLIERGVPRDKILRFSHDADSTQEEVVALAKFSVEHRFRSVIVVTSNYHTRRARYIFEKEFPKRIAVSVASAHDGDFDPERWWEHRKSQELFMREWVGLLIAHWDRPLASAGEK
jgi:uncharacterized SAM-binding protein YcdF (DUF218 family)